MPALQVAFGEIGLTGEIRAVSRTETRLKEAAQLGFTSAVIPSGGKEKAPQAQRMANVDALARFMVES